MTNNKYKSGWRLCADMFLSSPDVAVDGGRMGRLLDEPLLLQDYTRNYRTIVAVPNG